MNAEISKRVEELIATYGDRDAPTAALLCDGFDPDALAFRVVHQDRTTEDISYGRLRHESERFASALADLGIERGDRVATLMGKSTAYLTTLLGIWRLGAVHVPLFTAFAPAAISHRLVNSGAKIVVCDASQESKLKPGPEMPDGTWRVITTGASDESTLSFEALMAASTGGGDAEVISADDPIIHIFTSGTTGKPKGLIVPRRALAAFRAYAEFGLDLRPDDIFWNAADPGWAYGLYFGVLASLTTGTRSIMLEGGFSAESTLAVLAEQHVTNFTAAPTVYRSLRSSNLPVPPGVALRCASSAGEPLTPDVNEWAGAALGVLVHDHYGQTEAGMLINNHHHPLLRQPLRQGSMGHAMPGWTAAVLHEDHDEPVPDGTRGRVAIVLAQSPFAWFKGYSDDPGKSAEKFAGDGRFYLTGDVGSKDKEGYFHFSSRDDDVIIMAGYRIGPFDVESVISNHPAVAECAVIAVPDEVRGEVIEAYVVLREPASGSEDLGREIRQWVKTRYAAHAYPRAVHFAEKLPKTPSGKIQRFVLRQQRRAELGGESAGKAQ